MEDLVYANSSCFMFLTGTFNLHRFEKAIIANAKQNVTLDVLSYHASASLDDAQKLRVWFLIIYLFFNLSQRINNFVCLGFTSSISCYVQFVRFFV